MADRPKPGSWFHSRPDERTSTGRAIKVRRAELGLGRRDLADRAGLSYPYLAEIENGKKQGSPAALGAVAAALGLSLSELLERGEVLAANQGEAQALELRAPSPARSRRGAPVPDAFAPLTAEARFEEAALRVPTAPRRMTRRLAARHETAGPRDLADAVRAVLAEAPPDVAAAALLDVVGEERIRTIVRDELRRAGVALDPPRD